MKDISDPQLIRILTERLRVTGQLKNENAELEKQIGLLNQKLLDSETFKSHFISNVTNEIINPFSSVMGLSKSIMALEKDQLNKIKELAGLIYSESSFLDFQLSNIFTAAQLESGVISTEISSIDMGQLVDDVIESLKHESDRKQIGIITNRQLQKDNKSRFYFKCDREKLKIILVNLLINAIKFSENNKTIFINAEKEENTIIIEIRDEGKGMTKQEMEIIFDRFQRADNQINSLSPGNGLGLAVVDGLVQLLDGEIDVKSESGIGSSFLVRIPEAIQKEDFFDQDGLFLDDDDAGEKF